MISGAAQADVCLLMVPADGNFTTAIQKGDHKAAEIQGQTRQHARLINLLGVRQLLVGVNKMDSDTAGYKVRRPPASQHPFRRPLLRILRQKHARSAPHVLQIHCVPGNRLLARNGRQHCTPPSGSCVPRRSTGFMWLTGRHAVVAALPYAEHGTLSFGNLPAMVVK